MLNWNSKHSKCVAKTSKMLTARFQRYELRTKTWCLITPLFLRMDKDKSAVKKHYKASSGAKMNRVSIVIGTNKSLIVKPILLGEGVLGGTSYLQGTLGFADQSLVGNWFLSILGSVGLNTVTTLCLVLRNENIWNTTFKWPWRRRAIIEVIAYTSIAKSLFPSSTIYRSTSIS